MVIKLINLTLLIAFATMGGCGPTTTFHFQVVDSSTGTPLSGVLVRADVSGSPLGFRPLSHSETHDFGPTDSNGFVDLGPILDGPHWNINIFYTNADINT
jgi:hypothetical protein